ncbi:MULTISPECIES: cytochrome b/b6 domain-containing protein [Vibrio]|uniref:cytochrome b/b6 domain-containing protein n=1 Tax=Vibrio TaxID=662 RepID=UPI0022CD8ED1|nr:cytochrome b/b6 domain-containing protein [Vibrio sp. MM46]MDA0121368.1 cytochrome b/b6 domain-containing protein [Vibrio sp. MM46]HDM8155985.1 cytochrome b/b6 domain-containing protein [Vibrio harveyi]HDM8197948.1 cytochrome b/b6 domain-containing protein [Vibrio harveyi]
MKIWDLATRLYHWSQVLLFIALMASGLSGNGPHIQLGLALFTLLVWRMVWGFIGSETNLFRQFLRSPEDIISYLKGKSAATAGHNPAGGWMVVTMLTALLLQCISGMALGGVFDTWPYSEVWLNDDVFAGMEWLHLTLVDLLPILIALHIGAILLYKLKGKPLVKAMITGKQTKTIKETSVAEQKIVYLAPQSRALGVLVAATLVTMTIVALS